MNSLTTILVVLLALVVNFSWAETCPDPVSTQQAVFSVEESNSTAAEKIEMLLKLRDAYDHCPAPKDSVYGRIVHRLGDLYRLTGDFENGIAKTKEALLVNKRVSPSTSPSFLTNSYYNLGLFHALMSSYEESNEYFDSCIYNGKNYMQKLHIVLMAYEQKCFNYFTTGKYQESVDAADNGIFIARQSGNRDYQAILLQQKAQAQLALHLPEEAESNGKLAIEILRSAESIAQEYLASAYATYARVLGVGKAPATAIEFYQRSIALNKAAENYSQCAADYMDLGYLYDHKLNDTTKALQCYGHALKVMSPNPDPYQLATLYNNLGVVHWRNGRYDKAIAYYQKGLNALPIGFSDTNAAINPTSAMMRHVTNHYSLATLLENKAECFLTRYKTSGKKEYLKNALTSYKAADKVVDQMRRHQFQENSKLFWRTKTRRLYENAVETCYLLQDKENAFFFFEKSRAVLLNDKLNELGANRILSENDARRERELRGELFALQMSMQNQPPESEAFNEIKGKWYESQANFEKHIRSLEKKHPLYFQYKYDTTNYSIRDIRNILSENDQTLLEYFTSDTVIYSLMVSADSISFQKRNFGDFRQTTDQYLELCSRPSMKKEDFAEFVNTSHALFNRLFRYQPVQNKRVVVSFDDYFIPFESLLKDRHDPASFLLNDHVFLYVYSASHLIKKNDQNPVHNSILGVAPVSYSSTLNLAPLRGAEASLKRIESYFERSFSLVNETANKKSFLSTFPSYPVVHVYSHAMADYAATEPKLYFHDEPVLLRELQMLPEVKTQLIVLSGCRTGVGKTIKGEGVFSLARGFSALGIPSIITTLWSVDDQMTYKIMEKFYEQLQNGKASDEALQEAKLAFLLEQDGEKFLPYYWASTVILGNTMRIEETKPANSFYVSVALGITMLLSITAFLIRRRKAWTFETN